MDDHEILLRNHDCLLLEVDFLDGLVLRLKRQLEAEDIRIELLKVELEHKNDHNYPSR